LDTITPNFVLLIFENGEKERYYVNRYFKKDIKREAEIAVVTSRPKNRQITQDQDIVS
jgi:hypothetical protein